MSLIVQAYFLQFPSANLLKWDGRVEIKRMGVLYLFVHSGFQYCQCSIFLITDFKLGPKPCGAFGYVSPVLEDPGSTL
jgi:hypothetical protein